MTPTQPTRSPGMPQPGRGKRGCLLLQLLLACALPMSAGAASPERNRIAAERRTLTAQFDAEERVCRERFIVTSCVDDVRARKRAALAPLRERELQIDDAERRARAAQRQKALSERSQAAAQRASEPASAPEVRLRRPSPAASSSALPRSRHVDDRAERAAQAAERVQAAEQRQQTARQAQERIAQRLAERERKGKQGAPLPLPGSAASR